MRVPVSHQILEAAASLFLGLAAGFLYDFFRVIRRRLRLPPITILADLLFWIAVGIALF
jgi:hypothetical protein